MATLGMVFPSLVIISLVASVLSNFMENTYVGHALAGIRAVVDVYKRQLLELPSGRTVSPHSVLWHSSVLIYSVLFLHPV